MDVSEDSGTPKSSILRGFSIIITIDFGVPLFLETPIYRGLKTTTGIKCAWLLVTFWARSWMSVWAHHLASRSPYLALRCGHLWALPKVWPEAEIRGNVAAGREWPATCGTGGLQHPKGYSLSYSLSYSVIPWVHCATGQTTFTPWKVQRSSHLSCLTAAADLWFIYLQTLQLPAKRRTCGRCNCTTIQSQVPSKTCFMTNHFQNTYKPMSIMECPRWFKPWPFWDGENVTFFKSS